MPGKPVERRSVPRISADQPGPIAHWRRRGEWDFPLPAALPGASATRCEALLKTSFVGIPAGGPVVCRTNGPAPAPGSDDICERSRRFRSLRSLKPNYSVLGEAGR